LLSSRPASRTTLEKDTPPARWHNSGPEGSPTGELLYPATKRSAYGETLDRSDTRSTIVGVASLVISRGINKGDITHLKLSAFLRCEIPVVYVALPVAHASPLMAATTMLDHDSSWFAVSRVRTILGLSVFSEGKKKKIIGPHDRKECQAAKAKGMLKVANED